MKTRKGKRGQFQGAPHEKKRVGTRDGKAVLRLESRVKAWQDDFGKKIGAFRKPGRG